MSHPDETQARCAHYWNDPAEKCVRFIGHAGGHCFPQDLHESVARDHAIVERWTEGLQDIAGTNGREHCNPRALAADLLKLLNPPAEQPPRRPRCVSGLCKRGEHDWCMNRDEAETHCECECHARIPRSKTPAVAKCGQTLPDGFYAVGTSVCIYDVHNRLLLGQRKKPPYEGSWATPGGKLAPIETVGECAIREVKEETNLDIYDIRHLGYVENQRDDGSRYLTLCLRAIVRDVSKLENCEPDSHYQWRWFTEREVGALGIGVWRHRFYFARDHSVHVGY